MAKAATKAQDKAAQPAPGALQVFQRRRREESRERLLAAASAEFCERGYVAVSVEEIASAAGVSRMTFYRHFGGKEAIVTELFQRNAHAHIPILLSIRDLDFRDRPTVMAWIGELFASDRQQRQLLKVFLQANVSAAGFTQEAHSFIRELIEGLGETIDAFAVLPDTSRRRWIEAWLLIYEILDQSNHASRDSGPATDPLMIEILADRFLKFVALHET